MKYIVFALKAGDDMTLELPIIFPNVLVHADVAKAISGIAPLLDKAVIVSAGEWNGLECSGGSETLSLRSRGNEDARLIMTADYGGGWKG